MKDLTYAVFSEQRDTSFLINIPDVDEPIELRLDKTTLKASDEHREQFSLVFQGPKQPVLPQQTYCLEHQHLGELTLFMVPIGEGHEGVKYEVVFNRLHQDTSHA